MTYERHSMRFSGVAASACSSERQLMDKVTKQINTAARAATAGNRIVVFTKSNSIRFGPCCRRFTASISYSHFVPLADANGYMLTRLRRYENFRFRFHIISAA